MKKVNKIIIGYLLCAVFLTEAWAQEEITIPMSVKRFLGEARYALAAVEYKPEGAGPFPLVLINHGSPRSAADRTRFTGRYKAQSDALVEKGFVVINPLRRGYGKSDGPWAEDFFACANPWYYEAGLESAKDIAAAIDYARTRPYIDSQRIIVIGQSAGGFGALALASQQYPGVIGVVNFAGGRGSQSANEVCNADKLVDAFQQYAATTRVPMLWMYSENDQYFAPSLTQRFLQAYQKHNIDVTFVSLPPYGNDGHNYFGVAGNVGGWMSHFEAFFNKLMK